MYEPLKIALRFLLIVAALTLLAVVFTPSDRSGTPYVSALSDLTTDLAIASPKKDCEDRQCNSGTWADGCRPNQGTYCKRTVRERPGGVAGCASFICT